MVTGVNAFEIQPGTGQVATATTDIGTQAGDIQIYANYFNRDPDPLRSLVFNCNSNSVWPVCTIRDTCRI